MLDLFRFSSASDAELIAVGHRFARSSDMVELDAIATGNGVLVVRQPRRVPIVTDLAGVWPVFYATVAGSLIYSSSAAAIAAQVGGEVDEQWLAARLLAASIPEAWSDGSPYRHVRAVPAGGVLLATPAYLADLARHGTQDKLRRHAADWARLRHRPAHRLVAVATQLARTTRVQALEDRVHSLEHDSASPTGPRRWEDLISWVPALDCHHWFTQHARQLAATALRATASMVTSNDVAPGDATSLAMVRAYGRAHRIHTALAAAQSVQLHAPYLDDAVVTACLAVPAAYRTWHAARSPATSTPGNPTAWLPPDSAASGPAAPQVSGSCSPAPRRSFALGTCTSPALGRPKNRSGP